MQQPENVRAGNEPTSWVQDVSVLWSDWTIIPRQDMNRVDMANAVARLGVFGGAGLALLFRSFIPIGIGMLLLVMSRQMLGQQRQQVVQQAQRQQTSQVDSSVSNQVSQMNQVAQSTESVNSTMGAGASVVSSGRRKKDKTSRRRRKRDAAGAGLEYPSTIGGGGGATASQAESGEATFARDSWQHFFTGASAQAGPTGASAQQPEISQVRPSAFGGEGDFRVGQSFPNDNLVPFDEVTEFQAGGLTMRTPFPRPLQANDAGHYLTSPSTVQRDANGNVVGDGPNPWAGSAPFHTGFPTEYGPAPTARPPSGGQWVRDLPHDANPLARQAGALATAAMHGQYQPTQSQTWGAFMSDGGATSSPVTVPVPSGTAGSNFATSSEYTPRNMAAALGGPAEPPLVPPSTMGCFPPDRENPLGNPPVASNRVARPQLCPPVPPSGHMDESTQFVDALYESPAQIAAGYQFFPFPVQDVVEARDNFQDWVISSGQTHFRDKYSGQENVGIANIVDNAGEELGY